MKGYATSLYLVMLTFVSLQFLDSKGEDYF